MKTIKYLFSVSLLLILLTIVFNSPAEAAAPYGNYLEMHGGYIKAISSDVTSPNGFTFEAWVKPDSTSGIRPIFVVRNYNGGVDDYNYWVGINGGSLAFN